MHRGTLYLQIFIHRGRGILFVAYGKGLRSVKTAHQQAIEPHAGFTCTRSHREKTFEKSRTIHTPYTMQEALHRGFPSLPSTLTDPRPHPSTPCFLQQKPRSALSEISQALFLEISWTSDVTLLSPSGDREVSKQVFFPLFSSYLAAVFLFMLSPEQEFPSSQQCQTVYTF